MISLDFDHGIIAGSTLAGLSILETDKQTISRESVLRNVLLMREVRGEWPNWMELTRRLQ